MKAVKSGMHMHLELDGNGFANWCSRIGLRSILELTGLDQIWETNHIENIINTQNQLIVRRLTQQLKQDSKISGKLRVYKI